MTATRHGAPAVGVTSASAPEWRVEFQTGTNHLVAEEPANMAGGSPTPIGLLLCALAVCTALTLRPTQEQRARLADLAERTPVSAVEKTPTARPTS